MPTGDVNTTTTTGPGANVDNPSNSAAPNAPSNLYGEALGGARSVYLIWDDNATNENNYVLERSTQTGVGFTQVVELGENSDDYYDTSTAALTTYIYRVYATNTSGNSNYSNEFMVSSGSDIVGSIPLATGNKWVYDLDWSRTCVGCSGVTVTNYSGQAVLVIEGQVQWNNKTAWQISQYEVEDTPTFSEAFKLSTEYLFQDSYGLERWDTYSSSWRRILSTQGDQFANNSLFFTRNPNANAETTQSLATVTIPYGDFLTVKANSKYRVGFSTYSAADHDEDHSEYYADNVGLVYSTWDFWFDDNNPSAIDVYETGLAELVARDDDAELEVLKELENNHPSSSAQVLSSRETIISGIINIADDGATVGNSTVLDNILGQAKIEDWYEFELTFTQDIRIDLIYEYYDWDSSSYNDIDLYLFRREQNGLLNLLSQSTRDGTQSDPQEAIALSSQPAGTYLVAIQAWNTPSGNVDYWFITR